VVEQFPTPDRQVITAGCVEHSVPGDFNRVGLRDVEHPLKGDEGGRVEG
jgi:hypothetical protein